MTSRTFNTTPAGTITKEQTLLSIRRLGVAGGANILKGNVVTVVTSGDDAGFVKVAISSEDVNSDHGVALANADNSSGTDGDISVPLAVGGHFVTVVVKTDTINPGDYVKVSSTAGKVGRFVPGTDNNNLRIGRYWGQEGGKVSKSGSSPYLESFTDKADFPPVNAVDADIIEIELL